MTNIGNLTAFHGHTRIATGSAAEVAVQLAARENIAGVLIWRDRNGQPIDLDLRGSDAEIRARYSAPPRKRGRPKLGVVAREVTLLPRHWEWLASQRGGASATLRRLIDAARKAEMDGDKLPRARIDAAWQFMSDMGGDLPGFEEASRALYAGDLQAVEARIADWPDDVRAYVFALLEDPSEA